MYMYMLYIYIYIYIYIYSKKTTQRLLDEFSHSFNT